MSQQRSNDSYRMENHLSRWLSLLAAAGGAVFVAGLFFSPHRVWGGYLISMQLVTSLALSGMVFLALLYLARAQWAAPLQGVPEAMARCLPLGFAMGILLLFGLSNLYEWAHPAAVEHDPLLQHKSSFLNATGFSVRLILAFLLWMILGNRLLRFSKERGSQSWPFEGRVLRSSAVFMLVFTVTYSVTSFDWLMSLEPHWFSTIFALYQLAGMGVAGLAVAILLALHLERAGPLKGVLRSEHLHDLGKLLFCMSLFWAYLWYCQYMLIWYVDIPEETAYFVKRQEGAWWLVVRCTLILKWLVPFIVLMPRWSCRKRSVLSRVSVVVLAGHLLDLYSQVGPSVSGGVAIGLWEVGPVVGALAAFAWLCLRHLGQVSHASLDDPRLAHSLHYHTP
ncbi:MAG: hypothetical protein DWQ01_01985 [Planctomycetota bacterium]|nr:MAG: hypothetical protein DWQ01_01985 [Planctomycetota bacterium]